MTDYWKGFSSSPSSFGRVGRVITPGNTDLPGGTKAVTLLTGGNITILPAGNADGDVITYTGVPAGFSPPYVVRRVTAATATVATIEG